MRPIRVGPPVKWASRRVTASSQSSSAPVPPVLPLTKVNGSLLRRDPEQDRRTSRSLEILVSMINSLYGQGYIIQKNPTKTSAPWSLGNWFIFVETRAPTVYDDSSVGASPGYVWIDTAGQNVYFCISAALQAALWRSAGQTGATGSAGAIGSQGPQGATGATGAQGSPGSNTTVAGGLTTPTTINDTVTYTTGGITYSAPAISSGQVYRLRAMGTFVAANSATARNAQVAPYWGSTQLTANAIAVLTNLGQQSDWEVEIILTGASTTSIYTSSYFLGSMSNSTDFGFPGVTSGTTTVSAGTQTLDLRFAMSVAVATDSWSVTQITFERII